jgi:hypothetical protein
MGRGMRSAWGATLLVLIAYGVFAPRDARAQTSTTGSIAGRVTDAASGAALTGVTVVATSPVLQGSQAAVSDAAGRYRIDTLPPGSYLVTFYYANLEVQRRGVTVPLGQVTYVNQRLDLEQGEGEVIEIRGEGSSIDPTSTNQGTRITQDQMQNVPIPGRTFSSTLGAAPGSAGDSAGIGFSGSTSLENEYVIDGVNTTGLTFGTVGSPLINEFIEEIQVITGGYQAEYGRATGAVVNVVTKQGSNEFHGSAFATIVPYQVDRTPVRQVQTSIDGTVDLDYSADFGVELGGPILKDRVWFYVGFAPQLVQNNVRRTVQRQKDCHGVLPDGTLSECDPAMYGDGAPDEDPDTGDLLYEPVDRRRFKTTQQTYQWVSKINVALSPEQQGQFSLVGTPVAGQGIFGVTGADRAMRADYYGLTTDLAAKWTSKFNDNKTELEGVLGWHRDKYDQDALDDSVLDTPSTRAYLFTLGRVGAAGGESMRAMTGCTDSGAGGGDPYPAIDNCPVFQYWLDSPGFTIDNLEDRRTAQAKVTQRVQAAGTHIAKAGMDLEDNRTTDVRHFTGGRFFQLINELSEVRVYRYVTPDDPDSIDVCIDPQGVTHRCDYLDRSAVTGHTFNWSAFAQDSWQIQPNLTLNAGLRYEEQRLRYADEIRGTTDPFTMEPIGRNAILLRNMWAPRVGLLYDVTKEGRSKVYTSYGRFYESIPMALNDFSFSGTTLYGAFFDWGQCTGGGDSPDSAGSAPSPYACDDTEEPQAGSYYRGGTTVVAPGTRAQYMDEILLGGEYEVVEDLTLGLTYKNRRLGRVLEDVSVDGASTYIIGNPGRFDEGEEEALEQEIEALPEGDPERTRLESRLESFRALRGFDTPRRDHDAVELTLVKRVSKNFFVQGSYTYSRTRGNYPGLLNGDTGDALPNASTQYDLAELLANRDGPLPQDRPHYLKLDGYYTFDFEDQGQLTTGIRYRAFSGTPKDALASHYLYGFGESYLLPRGSEGRSPAVHGTDLHLGYTRKLARGYELSGFVDIINFFNQEQVAVTDELYSFDNVNPVVGGDRSDLIWAKAQSADGVETNQPISRNIAYGTPLARYAPLLVRLGMRLSF